MNYETLEKAYSMIASQWPDARPTRGLICGSGWSDVIDAFEIKASLDYSSIPGFGAPGVVGHAGRLVWGSFASQETFIFQGRRHYYEGEGWTPVAIPIYILKKLGAPILVVTNAAGGIRGDMKPGDLMIMDDHINMLGANPLIGPHNEIWGPRFPDQSKAYDPALRELADRAGWSAGVPLTHGVYLASSGPTYETPAEIRAWRALGADAVGMSTVPEALLANSSGMRVLGLSCITNLAAGISPVALSHEEVTETTKRTMAKMKALLIEIWKELANV